MPGAYAHITLVNEAVAPKNLSGRSDIPDDAKYFLSKWLKFLELGAVSPDYPYLVIGSKTAAKWADAMHKNASGKRIAKGIELVQQLSGTEQEKTTAWLMGFAGHTFTDITIHPAVNLKVGPYEENKAAHRRCEMHQDAYICGRLHYSDIGVFEHLDSGIRRCGPDGEDGGLDPAISGLWNSLLQYSNPELYAQEPPNIDRWHNRFAFMVDNVAEEGGHLFPFARHLGTMAGMVYPKREEVDLAEFIQEFPVPVMSSMPYDSLFDRAVQNVLEAWGYISRGIFGDDNGYIDWLQDYSLDTGTRIDPATNEPTATDYLFWK